MSTVREAHAGALNLSGIVSGSLMVAGTAIGAGMLGLPFVTATAGFLGAWSITCAVWAFMLFTGLFYIEVTLQMPRGSNILSMTQRYLGKKTSLFAGFMFLFLYYCFLIAYLAGGGPLLQEILAKYLGIQLNAAVSIGLFGALLMTVIYFGAKAVDRFNLVLMGGMVIFYTLLLSLGFQETAVPLNFTFQTSAMFAAVPVLFGAFGYHNVIPSLCDYLNNDRKALHFSVIIGTVISLIVYLAWQAFMFKNVSLEIIEATLKAGKSPVFALQQALSDQKIPTLAIGFSVCALTTSVLGVGLSLVDFLRDGFGMKKIALPRIVLIALAFVPPIIFCFMNQAIFYKALSWAGGFGESFLNGILPILLVWAGRYILKETPLYRAFGEKFTLGILFLASLLVMYIEIMSSFT